jgi:hypothetical protein
MVVNDKNVTNVAPVRACRRRRNIAGTWGLRKVVASLELAHASKALAFACRLLSASYLRWLALASACSCMGARVRAEADGATRLARELIEATLARLDAAPDPQAEIARLLADARRLRHVRVTLAGEETPAREDVDRAPQWFTRLVLPNAAVTRIETGRGAAIMIAPNPADEIAEIWQEIVWLAIGGAGISVAAFGLVSLAVSRTLRPSRRSRRTEASGARRTFDARFADGCRFVIVAERINALAATLQQPTKKIARAAHDPCAGRRAKRHRPRSA